MSVVIVLNEDECKCIPTFVCPNCVKTENTPIISRYIFQRSPHYFYVFQLKNLSSFVIDRLHSLKFYGSSPNRIYIREGKHLDITKLYRGQTLSYQRELQ